MSVHECESEEVSAHAPRQIPMSRTRSGTNSERVGQEQASKRTVNEDGGSVMPSPSERVNRKGDRSPEVMT